MNPPIQSQKTTILPLLIALTLACFALSPTARAVTPAPDGGYPNFNTAEGDNALFSLDTSQGVNNTAIGFQALFSNTTGGSNTANGSNALYSNTTGYNNTAVGVDALLFNTIGIANTGIGAVALQSNTTGSDNVAIGDGLASNTTGSTNTAIGVSALGNNTIGSSNIAVGFFAAGNLTTGNNNIDIGNPGVAGESRTIRIGTRQTHRATFIAGISGGNRSNRCSSYCRWQWSSRHDHILCAFQGSD